MTTDALLPLCFVDLDDTLFQTQRKQPNHTGIVASMDLDGYPRSFFTKPQHLWVNWLLKNAVVIPVTARDKDQFDRVTIPFTSWAIVAMGAVIIAPNKEVDSQWEQHVLSETRPHQDFLNRLHEQWFARKNLLGSKVAIKLIRECSENQAAVMMTLKFKCAQFAQENHALLQTRVSHQYGDDSPWLCLLHDRQITLCLKTLTKREATEFLLKRLRQTHGPVPTMGLGDNLSDYSFMSLCDWRVIPSDSPLDRTLIHAMQ